MGWAIAGGLVLAYAIYQLGATIGWGQGWGEARDIWRADARRGWDNAQEWRAIALNLSEKLGGPTP